MDNVWVFNGERSMFPSGVFTQRELAEEWIRENKLTGTLTSYPINQGVYDWAIENDYFKPKREVKRTPAFIGSFTSVRQEHHHYEDGELRA